MLARHANGLSVTLPKSHRDLWEMFWTNATTANGPVRIVWTPAHRNVEQLRGDEKWRAMRNQFADVQAKRADFVARCPAYVDLVEDFYRREDFARKILISFMLRLLTVLYSQGLLSMPVKKTWTVWPLLIQRGTVWVCVRVTLKLRSVHGILVWLNDFFVRPLGPRRRAMAF